MKFKSLLSAALLSVCIILLAIYSCNKNTSTPIDLQVDLQIKEAKTFFSEKSKYGKTEVNTRKLTLNWEKARMLTFNAHTKFLVVPTEDLNTIVLKNGNVFKRNVLFAVVDDQLKSARISEIIGNKEYINKNIDLLLTSLYKKTIPGFTGYLKLYDINYNDIYPGVIYKDGAKTNADVSIRGNKGTSSKDAQSQRILSTRAAASEGYCVDTYLVTDYGDGTETWELLSHSCVIWDSQTQEYPSGGGSSGQGSVSTAPGQRFCPGSLNFKKGAENSFYETNVLGLKFENGTTVNSFNAYLFLPNGISDAAMHSQLAWDFLNQGYSAADYLASDPYFSDLFDSQDITIKYENGEKYWYFSEFAARYLTAYAFNLAAISIVIESSAADAANPLNTMAQSEFRTRAQQILRSFIPGTQVQSTLRTTTNTNATYGTACQY